MPKVKIFYKLIASSEKGRVLDMFHQTLDIFPDKRRFPLCVWAAFVSLLCFWTRGVSWIILFRNQDGSLPSAMNSIFWAALIIERLFCKVNAFPKISYIELLYELGNREEIGYSDNQKQ